MISIVGNIAAAGAAIGAKGYGAGPVVGTITTIGGGVVGYFTGEYVAKTIYETVFDEYDE